MRLSILFALVSFAACKSGPTDTPEGDTDTDTDTDTDADVDCDAPEADLGDAVGTALATGTTCGAGDDESATCGGDEDTAYSWTAPYAGTFTFSVGTAYDATIAVSETCPGEDELACGTTTVDVVARSGDEHRLTIDGNGACGDYSLDISGVRNDALTDASGLVVDASGNPVEGAQIRFCAQLCLNTETAADGTWSVRNAERTNTSLEVLKPGTGLATSYTVVDLPTGGAPTYTMSMHPLSAESPLTAAVEWHDLSGGLRVEVSADQVETPTFFDVPTGVAGVAVPQAQWPTMDGLSDVIAVWYTDPFDYPVPDGAPIEIDNLWSLTEGDVYRVYVGDYLTRAWIDSGTLTVGPNGLTGDAEIHHFSTIVLTGPVTP